MGARAGLRLPVQDCYRIDDKCILVGRVAQGRIHAGQETIFVPSGIRATVASVEVFQQQRTSGRSPSGDTSPLGASAQAGESIGFTLAGGVEVSRGQVACPAGPGAPGARVGSRLEARVFGLSELPLRIGEPLAFRCATQQVSCRIERIERLIDSSTLERLDPSAGLAATQVGDVRMHTDQPIAAEPFAELPELGRFVLVREGEVAAGGILVGVRT